MPFDSSCSWCSTDFYIIHKVAAKVWTCLCWRFESVVPSTPENQYSNYMNKNTFTCMMYVYIYIIGFWIRHVNIYCEPQCIYIYIYIHVCMCVRLHGNTCCMIWVLFEAGVIAGTYFKHAGFGLFRPRFVPLQTWSLRCGADNFIVWCSSQTV